MGEPLDVEEQSASRSEFRMLTGSSYFEPGCFIWRVGGSQASGDFNRHMGNPIVRDEEIESNITSSRGGILSFSA